MAQQDDDQPRRWWQTLPGLVVSVVITLTLLSYLVSSLDKTGFFDPGRGMEAEDESETATHIHRSAPESSLEKGPRDAVKAETAHGAEGHSAHGAPSAVENAANRVTGNYQGSQVNTSGYSEGMSFSFQMSLSHRGEQILGNYSNGAGDAGAVNGFVHDTTLEGRIESSMLSGAYCEMKAEILEDGLVIKGDLRCSKGYRASFILKHI